MIILTLFTQALVLIKNAIVASYFGIGIELDAYNLANRITTFVFSFIAAGISTVIIPYLKDKKNKKGINIFISVIYTIALLLLIVILFFNKEIILIAGGSENTLLIELAAKLMIFTALTGFLNSLIQLAKAILEFKDKFNTQKLIVLFSNIILVLMLFSIESNIYYYALVVFFTSIINLFLHLYFVRKGNFNYRINFDLKDQAFKEMLILFFPTMLSTGVYQISLLIDTLIAARLPIGSISTLNYANAIISLINVLLIGNITTFVYPKLVKKNNNMERQTSLVNYVLLINMLMCILVVLFYSSGKEGISILFERGNFTSSSTSRVFEIGLILILSLPTNAIRDLLYRYFYMNKDTYTPFKNSIIISGINMVISIILSKFFGLYGVVLGTTVSSYFSLILISIRFKKKFKIYFNKREFFIENFKIIKISLLTILASFLFKNVVIIENNFVGLIANSVFSLIIFTVLLLIKKSKIFNLKL